MKKYLSLLAVLLLSACATEWSDTGRDGMPFEEAALVCREKARQSARQQMPFGDAWQQGPAEFPPDSRHDIEERETNLCLMHKGFTLSRQK
jgi:hypothetical protein